MQQLVDFFVGLGPWNWFIIAVCLYLMELAAPGVHFMWFGVAATIMGGLMLAYPLSIELQLVAFAIIAILTILIARPLWQNDATKTDVPSLNERGHSYVGRTVVVEVPIADGRGKVRVGDTLWSATGPDLPAGTRVKITGVDGTVLTVVAVD